MGAFIDLTGETIGDWHVVRYLGKSMWECINDSQEIKNIHSYVLRTKLSNYTKVKDKMPDGILGKTFGQWTPTKYLGNGMWECECSCTNVGKVSTANLKNGISTKCTECKYKAQQTSGIKPKDKINEWTVMYYAGNMRWHCKCSCGNERDVLTKYLKDKSSKSCGHDRNYHIIRKDITGQTFGRLTVLGYTGQNNMWRCQCNCENHTIVDVARDSLLTGKTKSCGCLKEALRRETLLNKYGDTNTTRINNPREDWQIEIISSKELLEQYINSIEGIVTASDLAERLNVNDTTILKALKKFGLEDVIEHNDGVSDTELSILDWVESFGVDIITNDRYILNGRELDILIPSKKIAIEYNGSYWHSSLFKDSNYHQLKTIDCAKMGIHLIHIFEHEWKDVEKREKIKSYIKSLLTDSEVIYARNTTLEYLDVEKTKEFLNKYHMQGYASSSVNIGCIYNNEIIGIMTFGKPRFSGNYQYEIIRLCWKPDIAVVGGTEKIFKKFIRDFNPDSIVTYVDISKFTGNIYTKLGFRTTSNSITKPNYVWVNLHTMQVLKRYQTMKHKLLSEGLGERGSTETEIMESLGYIQVYDSGNLKLEWLNNN